MSVTVRWAAILNMISGGRDNKVIGGGVADGSVGQTISMPAIQQLQLQLCRLCDVGMERWFCYCGAGDAVSFVGIPLIV